MSDELIERLERLAQRFDSNHLLDQARGVRYALRVVRSHFAPVKLRGHDSWNDPKYVKPADCDEDGYCVDCRSATVHRDGCIVLTGNLNHSKPSNSD